LVMIGSSAGEESPVVGQKKDKGRWNGCDVRKVPTGMYVIMW